MRTMPYLIKNTAGTWYVRRKVYRRALPTKIASTAVFMLS
jgi:hypothetical protein